MNGLHSDGSCHFSNLKRIALSGQQYLEGLLPISPTPAMLLGSAVHQILLGSRDGAAPMVRYPGMARRGKEWDEFKTRHAGAEILTSVEWDRAEQVAIAVRANPLASRLLDGARLEVPLAWNESGIPCSTAGVDLIAGTAIGELKTSTTVHPETFQRQAFKMSYHCQLAFYLRGCRANGIAVPERPFVIAAETKSPFEVVVLRLTPALVELGDRTVTLWLERLRTYLESDQWPGYAQSEIDWDVPMWMLGEDEADDDDGEEVAA
jgi:hypothetical protein